MRPSLHLLQPCLMISLSRFLSKLLDLLSSRRDKFTHTALPSTYLSTRALATDFATYKQTEKRAWVVERQELSDLFANIQTKLRTYGMRAYQPPAGCELRVSRFRLHATGALC